jgi:hypothetical protein
MRALFLPIFDKDKNIYFDSGYLSFLVSENSKKLKALCLESEATARINNNNSELSA